MRHFYDCEFLEDGRTIELISIGVVADDGREYYAVNSDMPTERIQSRRWLMNNVVRHLPLRIALPTSSWADNRAPTIHLDMTDTRVKPRWVIANEVREFFLGPGPDVPQVELWSWCADYDHVLLMWLWGSMARKPDGLPTYTRDLQQEIDRLEEALGRKLELPERSDGVHDALVDARYHAVLYRFLREQAQSG